MYLFRASLWGVMLLIISACVTINVYFPAAAAEKAADQIIDQVWGKEGEPEENTDEENSSESTSQLPSSLAIYLLNQFIPSAQAAYDLDISSPTIQALQESMTERHQSLLPYYENGAIGITADGLIMLRDVKKVKLRERNKIKRLVKDENNDRLALYKAIAEANQHPEWEAGIRETFALRWIEKANKTWWYQNNTGAWKQK